MNDTLEATRTTHLHVSDPRDYPYTACGLKFDLPAGDNPLAWERELHADNLPDCPTCVAAERPLPRWAAPISRTLAGAHMWARDVIRWLKASR